MKKSGKVIFVGSKKRSKKGHIKVYYKRTINLSKMFCDILDVKHGECYVITLDIDKIKERKIDIKFGEQT